VCKQDFSSLLMHSRLEANLTNGINDIRTSYFAVRVMNAWNTLRADRDDFSSFAAFKRNVQQIDLSMSLLRYF